MTTSKPTGKNQTTHQRDADEADDRKERIATAWAELTAAAATDPKARAFLSAFGPAERAADDAREAQASGSEPTIDPDASSP